MGANFNQNLDALDYDELNEAGATWVRGFFPMPDADEGAPADHITIRTITDAAGRGYKTILSLKFPFTGRSFPAPGSPEMKAELARVNKVRRTPATARWMTFVRQTPEISGVDIHPHVPGPQAAQAFLDYILPKMRAGQTFLVTEFSLTPLWRQHMTDAIPASFATEYGFAQGTKVWQVIKAAIDNPFPEAKWAAFLRACPWFANHSTFLRNQMSVYRGTGRLAVATYAFKQDDLMVRNWGPEKDPWLLNSVYARYTVRPRGQLPGRSPWFADFRALQTP